jgi:uncharacterized SAM-binding protein YcdF (DUF218 family)
MSVRRRLGMIALSSPRFRPRSFDAFAGATVGVLAAISVIAADVPRLAGRHPNVFVIVCGVIGAVVGLAGELRRAAYAAAFIAVVAAGVALTPVVSPLARTWVRRDPAPRAPLDAIVVLSAGLHADGSLNARAAERLVSGIVLVRDTRTPVLVTTRDGFRVGGRTVDTDAAQQRLVRSLIDSVDWHIVAPVSTTHDEALRAAELLRPAGKTRIAVVTSPMHTRRACATFEAAGFTVVCVPSDEWLYSEGNLARPLDRIRAFLDYVYERLGVVEYRRRGWIR